MTISPSLDDEVAFLTGVKSDGTLTPTSYWGWNGDTPATYNSSWTRASKWGGTTAGTAGGTVYYAFNPNSNWSATEQTQLASGLALWAAVANINFVQTTNSSQAGITFTRGTDGGAYTYTIYSANAAGACQNGSCELGTITSAPISIDTSVGGFGPINGNFTNYGGYPIMTFLHEEGHALGLGHAGAYNDTVAGSQQFSAYDSRQFSIMSYFNPGQSGAYSSQYPVTGTNWNGNYATGLMPLDILAMQRLYGVAANTPLSGGQTFGFHCNIAGPVEQYFDFTKNVHPVLTIWDKGANNTLDLSGFGCYSNINLNGGTWSSTAGMKNNIAIAAGTQVDTLVCSGGGTSVTCNNDSDTVIGGAGNDVITLGTGNDVINGGGGTDTVKFGGTFASYAIKVNTDGSLTVSGSGIGTDTLTGIENLQFSDQSVLTSALSQPTTTPPPTSSQSTSAPLGQRDFNGDAKGDVLLTNNGCASVQLWVMNGTAQQSAASLSGPGSNWTTLLTGDFNGDGKTDVLWQNTNTSAIQIWTMNGTSRTASATLASVPGSGWSAVATGDFNGDKNTDVVLENGSQVELWLMSGSSLLSSSTITTAAPAGFKVVATGDFNGDGSTDILWQNPTTGQLDIWLMNGTSLASDNLLSSNPGSSWRVVDAGDFNGDGKSDILLQNSSTGQAAIWLMNGTTELSGSGNVSGNLGTGWKAVVAADYNGDGKSDILFRNPSSGAYTAWMMSGTTVLSGSGTLSANPGTAWHAVASTAGVKAPASSSTSSTSSSGTTAANNAAPPLPQRDFNGDGFSDVLLTNNGCASVQVWLMNGTTRLSSATLSGPGGAWTTLLTGDFNGDGKSDLLWQNTQTSAIQIWTMNGTSKAASTTVASAPGAGWKAVDRGDFNHDGTADIVLQNGGQVEIWLMNGASVLAGSGVVAGATAPSGFKVIGTGDFDGDGNTDILWQNTSTGQLDIWKMNGTALSSNTVLLSNPGSSWRAVATGDFNHDGKSDILLQNNSTGQAAIWFMDGANVLSGSGNVSQNLGSGWRAVVTGDYNNDGIDDILFRNPSNGQFAAFMMSGTTSVMSSGVLSVNPGTAWHAVA